MGTLIAAAVPPARDDYRAPVAVADDINGGWGVAAIKVEFIGPDEED